MARMAEIGYLGAVMVFVASGLTLATLGRPALPIAGPTLPEDFSYGPFQLDAPAQVASLPELYVQPQNPLMWSLLVMLWLLLILDGVGQYLDPSDRGPLPAWPPLTLCLVVGAIWPWIVGLSAPLATLGALLMLTGALTGALRARGQRRPAAGVLAGWCLAVGTATVATLIGAPLALNTAQTAILAILPGALIGMAVQGWLGRSISFSLAMIWAFCALAVTTMGSSPGVALAAIIGISGMGVVLVRAAT